MALFSLVAVFVATFAWFFALKNVTGTGMVVKVKEDGKAFSALTVHRCKTNESTNTKLKFYSQDNGSTPINLDYYSQLNMSQPVLMLFKLTPGGVEPSKVKLTVTSDHPEAYDTIEQTNTDAPNYYGNFSFSSAVGFKVIPYTISQYDTTPVVDPVNSSNITYPDPFNFENVDVTGISQQSFVQVSNGDLVWSHKTNGVNDASFNLYSSTDTSTASDHLLSYLAVIFDYNQEALTQIYSKNLTNTHDLVFDCDFSMLIS